MRRLTGLLAIVVVGTVACVTGTCQGVTFDTVLVGDPGNAADTTGYGAVDHVYQIGKYEVTNSQYAEFLNAAAKTDTFSLYNTSMNSDARGGITRSGLSGDYTYTIKDNMGNKPVNYVSFWEAARFCNWLHNGQGNGSTETGAYINIGNQDTFARQSNAQFFIPTENEWYKAAYYEPGVSTNGYWNFPTRSDSAPTLATTNTTGDISNPGISVANYNNGADWNNLDGNFTTVGSAGADSASYYGTFDQGGNVLEWNETAIDTYHGLRGGSFLSTFAYNLDASYRDYLYEPSYTTHDFGFRVASVVPEPGSFALMLAGAISLLGYAWRRRRQTA